MARYSKYIAEAEPNRLVLEDGDRTKALWFVADGASFTRKFLTNVNNFVIEFNTQGKVSLLFLPLNESSRRMKFRKTLENEDQVDVFEHK